MKYLPINLNLTDKKILIVGAGSVARQKIKTLSQFECALTVLAPHIPDDLQEAVSSIIQKEYDASSLDGFSIVYGCTDDEGVNERIKKDAEGRGVLVNIVDNPRLSDFVSPALYLSDPMSVAVSSDASDVKKSIELRDKIREALENDKV